MRNSDSELQCYQFNKFEVDEYYNSAKDVEMGENNEETKTPSVQDSNLSGMELQKQ